MKPLLAIMLLAVFANGQQQAIWFEKNAPTKLNQRWRCVPGPYHYGSLDVDATGAVCMESKSPVHLWFLGRTLFIVNDEGYASVVAVPAQPFLSNIAPAEEEKTEILTFENGVH